MWPFSHAKAHIEIEQCMKKGVVDNSAIYVDSTHVKAHTNNKNLKKITVAKRLHSIRRN